jgi:hypothetical protein
VSVVVSSVRVMDSVVQVVTLIGAAVALLAFFSEYKTRFRRAIRESLELSTLFADDQDLSRRFRSRADALAHEYLAEAEKSDYPAGLKVTAGAIGFVVVLGGAWWWGLDSKGSDAETFAANVVAGLAAGLAGLIVREPLWWLVTRARAVRARITGRRRTKSVASKEEVR